METFLTVATSRCVRPAATDYIVAISNRCTIRSPHPESRFRSFSPGSLLVTFGLAFAFAYVAAALLSRRAISLFSLASLNPRFAHLYHRTVLPDRSLSDFPSACTFTVPRSNSVCATVQLVAMSLDANSRTGLMPLVPTGWHTGHTSPAIRRFLIATPLRIENRVSPHVHNELTTSNRNKKHRFALAVPPLGLPSYCAIQPQINRHNGLIELLVSYSKQRTAPKINRHISGAFLPHSEGSANRQPLLTSHNLSACQFAFSSHSLVLGKTEGPITTCHCLSRYNGGVPIKLIAMDIDGTLLDSSSRLSDDNSRTVAEAASRGIEILLATGRRFHSARVIAEMLPCELGFIVNNGSLLKSKDGVTQQRHSLPWATARRVLEHTPEFRSCAAVVFDRPLENQVVLEQVDFDDPFRGGYFRRSREYIAQVSPLTDCLNGEDPIQVMYVGACKPMREAMQQLESLPFAHEYALSLTEYEHKELSILDVLRRGVSKGVALAEWARRRGFAREEVMAIGDNWNDREMLEFAGRPVVMGNAVAELKSLGHAVTLSNDQSGVAEAIRTYALDGNA
jgi:5-amino-6-(5-phospho-D-ribitylamino)uracil phosphatase